VEQAWLHTDEAEDVAGSVRQALRMAALIDSDDQVWKWLSLALHSALQGACVCHVVTSASPVGAVTENNAKEWLEYFDQSRIDATAKPPKTYLLNLPALLKRVRMPHSAGDGQGADGIAIADAELEWLTRFNNEIRNQFVHFEPMGWAIEVSGIPAIARLIGRILSDVLHGGYAFRHLTQDQRDDLNLDIQRLVEWGTTRLVPTTPSQPKTPVSR
jgi:hypothetical protein